MKKIIAPLLGGDRRSIGASNRIVRLVIKKPALFKQLLYGIVDSNPLIAMRCADAAEKITVIKPAWLQPHKLFILKKTVLLDQPEVRWHVAQIIPRLTLTPGEKNNAFNLLFVWAKNENEKSNIVRVFSLQSAYDLARDNPGLLKKVLPLVKSFSLSKIPSLRSRAKKLLLLINKK